MITTKSPIDYKPVKAEDFIGQAKQLSGVLDQVAARTIKDGQPVRILIRGTPGIGKSALLDTFLQNIGATQWSTTKLNGTQLKVESLDDWARSLHLSELYGYRALRLEEVDKVNSVCQARMLTVLDELPDRCAVVCTSNRDLEDFDPRFVSRFQTFTLEAPDATEIAWLLKKFGLRKDDITRISNFSCGNVRLALFDAQSALDELAALKGGRL